MIKKYRRNLSGYEVEAIQFQDDNETIEQIQNFLGCEITVSYTNPNKPKLKFYAPSGARIIANVGDYILKEKDDVYAYSPNTFNYFYEEVK